MSFTDILLQLATYVDHFDTKQPSWGYTKNGWRIRVTSK